MRAVPKNSIGTKERHYEGNHGNILHLVEIQHLKTRANEGSRYTLGQGKKLHHMLPCPQVNTPAVPLSCSLGWPPLTQGLHPRIAHVEPPQMRHRVG
jgi:hypothetical protein